MISLNILLRFILWPIWCIQDRFPSADEKEVCSVYVGWKGSVTYEAKHFVLLSGWVLFCFVVVFVFSWWVSVWPTWILRLIGCYGSPILSLWSLFLPSNLLRFVSSFYVYLVFPCFNHYVVFFISFSAFHVEVYLIYKYFISFSNIKKSFAVYILGWFFFSF